MNTMRREEAPGHAAAPLNVLILSPDERVRGGVTAFIAMLTAHLAGCNVTKLVTGSLGDAGERNAHKESFMAVMMRVAITPFRVLRLIRRQKFDVLHINPSFEEKSLGRDCLILLALQCAGVRKILVYFHGWRPGLARSVAKTVLLKRLLALLLNRTARILVLAPEFKQALEKIGVDGQRIFVTTTMFDGEALNASRPSGAPSGRTILFMSRFARKKGVYELLEAFARIADRHKDVTLVMAGDGEEMEGLRERATALHLNPRVRFPGYVQGAQKWTLLHGCTIYVLPTYFAEGMPVALLEAMGAGKPLLTSCVGGIGRIASDGVSGVVLAEITADSVEQGLEKLLTDPHFCKVAGAHNRRQAWSRFEASRVTREIESVYNDIARGAA